MNKYRVFRNNLHHNDTNVISIIKDYGNPFLGDSGDLLALHTKVVMSEDVRIAEELGNNQYKAFTETSKSDFTNQ